MLRTRQRGTQISGMSLISLDTICKLLRLSHEQQDRFKEIACIICYIGDGAEKAQPARKVWRRYKWVKKMHQLLKQLLLICVCSFALTGHAMVESPAISVEPTAGSLLDAERAYAEGDYVKAEKVYRSLAEQGVLDAQLILGSMYDIGLGVHQDYPEAVKWYRLAAEQGNAFAQEKLGWKYILGEGVPQDDVLAHMWLNLAASEDSAPGQKIAIRQRLEQRDAIARRMTAKQIAKARELAKKCKANKFRGC